jgi:hypothetical protein
VNDWLDTLASQDLEIAVPTFALIQDGAIRFRGSGRLHWRADSDVRVMGTTDGASELRDKFGRTGAPGQLLPQSAYLSMQGQTPDGWEVSTEQVSSDGYLHNWDSPHVTWDFFCRRLTLSRIHARMQPGQCRLVRGLIGPPPSIWTRVTETEIRNDYFGSRSFTTDWLVYRCQLGDVAARQRSEEWFEVRLDLPGDADPPPGAFEILSAIRTAFSFALGKRLLIRGIEDIRPDREIRLLATDRGVARNSLPKPLGTGSAFHDNIENLLACATDFFLTNRGGPVAQQLALCWDTADNHFSTQLAVASICVEALLRLTSDGGTKDDPGFIENDRSALVGWLCSQAHTLSARFLKRMHGFVAALRHRRPIDTLWDWEHQGILSVTAEDIRAWESIRNPAAHGGLFTNVPSPDDLQAILNAHHRVQNLINRLVLHLIDYQGRYVDYAQPGWPETPFPAIRPPTESTSGGSTPV